MMKKNVTHSVKTLFFVAACAFAATALFTACGNIGKVNTSTDPKAPKIIIKQLF